MWRAARLLLALGPLAACGCASGIESLWKAGPTREEACEGYLRACARCHGADGKGTDPEDAQIAGPVPDLTTLAARYGGVFPREYVIDVITRQVPIAEHSGRGMPVSRQRFGAGSGATAGAAFYARRRLDLLADHIESLQRPAAP